MNSDGFLVDLGIWLFYQLLVEPQNPSPLESFSFQIQFPKTLENWQNWHFEPKKSPEVEIRNIILKEAWHHLLSFHGKMFQGFSSQIH